LHLHALGIAHEHCFAFDDVSRIARASAGLELKPYREFLALQPQNALDRLNEFFDVNLSMLDLKSVYNAPLHRKSRSLKDTLVAALIYAKNYRERDARPRNDQVSRAASV